MISLLVKKDLQNNNGVIMPLIKSTSKKAMATNIKKEMIAGKPQNQAVAIAYSVKHKAAKGKK